MRSDSSSCSSRALASAACGLRGQRRRSGHRKEAPSGRPTAAISPAHGIRRSTRSPETTSTSSRSRGGSRPTRSARARVQLRGHAADGRRRRLLDRRHAPRRRRARRRHRRDAVDAQRERRQARRGGAAAALRPRPRLLARHGQQSARIVYVTPGYQMVALDAKTGVPAAGFGKNGIVDLKTEDDQPIDLDHGRDRACTRRRSSRRT